METSIRCPPGSMVFDHVNGGPSPLRVDSIDPDPAFRQCVDATGNRHRKLAEHLTVVGTGVTPR
jgi:hypothetical protein